MSTRSKGLSLVAILMLIATSARSDGLGNMSGRIGQGEQGGIGGAFTAAAPPVLPTGKILRIDAVSHILRIDGTSKICRIGGC